MSRLALLAVLVIMGAGWGLTQPLVKISVSTGYQPLGLVFWQLAIGALLLGLWQIRVLGRVPVRRATLLVWAVVAVLGTVLPNSASYAAAAILPAGIMSIVIAAVPLFAFPMALALGTDRFSPLRLLGLVLGLCAVVLIAAPEAALPERAMVAALPIALIAPFCYAVEGNWVDKFGTAGLSPIEVLFGASVAGALIAGPLAVGAGQFIVPQFPLQLPDYTLILSASIHVLAYTAYVGMVARSGAVFASQVSYLVTGFGVVWSMLILGERYSLWIWAALGLMALGLTLVQPRGALARESAADDTDVQRRRDNA